MSDVSLPPVGPDSGSTTGTPSGPAPAGSDGPVDRWHRYTTAEPTDASRASAVIYGTDIPSETDLRLLGNLDGKRVLDLGCGIGHNAVQLARQGAKLIAVDPNAALLHIARERADDAEVKIELHQSGLADLAFLRSDSVDAALSVMALAAAEDLARVFRQVHRVLKPEAAFVMSFPHPAIAMFDPDSAEPTKVLHPYHRNDPMPWTRHGVAVTDHPRTIAEIFTTLHRSSFSVDQLIEPANTGSRTDATRDLFSAVPTTLVIRARKQGN